jgi:palmitoyltransferase
MRPGERNKRANIIIARFIPLLLVGIIAYCSWVVTRLVVVEYLINPSPSLLLEPRVGPAIAILIIFYTIEIILLACYGRLVHTIITNPGVVPRGAQFYVEAKRKPSSWTEKSGHQDVPSPRKRRYDGNRELYTLEFWRRDVWTCNFDGRSRYCSTCFNFKVDRVSHCSEIDRCVYKMDHFCPWVSGIVSESSFKFFIQFCFWATLFTFTTLVVMAYYFAERRKREGFINVHWILALAFAALFFIFSAGMCGSSLQFAFENTTTIENLSRRSKVWYLAIYIPPNILQKYLASSRSDLRLITYPRPPSEQIQLMQNHGADVSQSQQNLTQEQSIALPPATHDPSVHQNSNNPASTPFPPPTETRTFAIVESRPGENPFDIGLFNNFREVMGFNLLDWLFPISHSPCMNHDSMESMYKTGAVVERLKREAGIVDDDVVRRRHSSRRRRRKRRQSSRAERRSGSRGKEERTEREIIAEQGEILGERTDHERRSEVLR